eukprot:TRINITY_DN22073_c0_g1_i1.p1 TRINITY_DN22073_c0_g1~~TRINITY_DN22073_c0_g1_i1.p1  ORF type:complete len:874 (+),score=327.79 TRINITY_DN22073_c0_g1_i1:76-2622(+)
MAGRRDTAEMSSPMGGADDDIELDELSYNSEEELEAEEDRIPIRFVMEFFEKKLHNAVISRELFIFVPFFIMFLFFATHGRNVTDSYFIGHVLRDTALGNEIPFQGSKTDRAPREITRTFEQIVELRDFYDWMQGTLVPNIWTCSADSVQAQDFPRNQGLNYLVGSMRIRTLRANRQSCVPDNQLFKRPGQDLPSVCEDIPTDELWRPPNIMAVGSKRQCWSVVTKGGVTVTLRPDPASMPISHLGLSTEVFVEELSADKRMARIAGPVAGWLPTRNLTTNETLLHQSSCVVDCINCLGHFNGDAEETAMRYNISNPLLDAQERVKLENRLYKWSSCEDTKGGTIIVGDLDYYHCGGYIVDVPFNEPCGKVQELMDVLRGDGWEQDQTEVKGKFVDEQQSRFAVIEYFTYTPQPNVFVSAKLYIEIGPSGIIHPRHQFRAFKVWTASQDTGATVYSFFFFTLVLLLLVNFGLDWRASYKRSRRILYFLIGDGCVWNLLEFANLIMLIAVMGLRWAWWDASRSAQELQFPVESYPPNLDFLKDLYMTATYLNSVNIVLTFLKILKYCQLYQKLNILTSTLDKAKDKVIGVMLLFCWSVFAYAMAGHLLFGGALFEFRNLNTSFSTLMRMLLGDFDYPSLRRENRVLAGLYFWSFSVLCLFLLLNFIIAILGDGFSQASAEVISVPFHDDVLRLKRRIVVALKPSNIISSVKLTLKRKSRGHLLDRTYTNIVAYNENVCVVLDADDEKTVIGLRMLKSFMGAEACALLGEEYIGELWSELQDDYNVFLERSSEGKDLQELELQVVHGVQAALAPAIGEVRAMPELVWNLEQKLDEVVFSVMDMRRRQRAF